MLFPGFCAHADGPDSDLHIHVEEHITLLTQALPLFPSWPPSHSIFFFFALLTNCLLSLYTMRTSYNLLVVATILGLFSSANGVDFKTCNRTVSERLHNGTLSPRDQIFHFKGSEPMSKLGDIQLTIDGCKSVCPSPDFDLYDDLWPRVLTWLIPALLLVGNLHVARVGTFNRFLAILHFIGDPIDSAWSLLAKAEVWSRFYSIAKQHTAPGPGAESSARALAALLSAFEELTGDMTSVYQELDAIINDQRQRLSPAELDHIMLEAAEELVDSRSNEVLRTTLVILNYLWAVLCGFVPDLGGPQSSIPGGRIGTAMFLSWLVTVVMLSNTLSGFVSRRTCLRIMERYFRTLKGRSRDQHYFPNSPLLGAKSGWRFKTTNVSPSDFINAQPWNGSLYSYRPNKHLVRANGDDSNPLHLAILSISPVLVAAASALTILWFTPTVGLDCRGLWIIACALALLGSPILTWLIQKVSVGRLAWYLTTAKDAVVGVSILIVIVASSIGVFNTCECW